MMEIAIVTPHAVYNYGAVLQAYALYSYLSGKNNTVYMYDFPPHIGGKPNSIKERVYEYAKEIGRFTHKIEIEQGEREFDSFISQFQMTKETNLPLYIVGSDQVWNPNNLDDIFSLSFVEGGSMTASYAASMGISTVPKEREIQIKSAIDRLDYLSAREPTTAREVERITGRKCRVDVDPTFLLERELWKKEEKEISIKKPYILVYLLHIPNNIKEIINKVKSKYGCNVILIDRSGFLRYGFPYARGRGDIGPREFLWLMHHAEHIITSSFHGTAFSIIFEKPFSALINQNSPSRISNLLSISGIDIMGENIDYSAVKKNMEKYIINSKMYLDTLMRASK